MTPMRDVGDERVGVSDSRLLQRPDLRYRRSLIDAVAEFDGARMDGAGQLNGVSVDALRIRTAAAELVAELASDHEVAVADGSVRATSLWMVRDDELVGFLQIRHGLTSFLLDRGGHIGYSVRPSARRQGLATRALAEAVKIAGDLGLDRILVACEETNPGSRAAIERNRGRYENSREGLRRYWIETAASVEFKESLSARCVAGAPCRDY